MPRLSAFAVLLISVSAGLTAPAKAAVIEVTIAKMTFSPAAVTAQAGDTIEWVSKDFVGHTATARDKSFDVTIPAHGTGSVVVKNAGGFDYFCRFHPMMKGSIQVNSE